jgi:hypothetical protein
MVFLILLIAFSLALVTLASGLLWKEFPGKLGSAGVGLAIVAVVLVNLGP